VRNLVKKYGDFEAVRGISFEVKRGEIFSLLGPNGAGKTTTIHIISTLLRPTSGEVIVAGHSVTKEPARVREKIGIVFQDPSLDDNLTAYENMYIHGRLYGIPPGELRLRIRRLLEFVELDRFADRIVRYYSGGMRRRLEIARALLHEPEIMILDEPTIGLDPQSRAKIWDYIRSVKERTGMTILLTTHYMDEAEMLSDRIAIMDHGKIIALGTSEELKAMVGNDIILARFNVRACIEDEYVKSCKILPDGRVELVVDNAPRTLPLIFEYAHMKGLRILEVSYRKPTLNEVFLHLTGRELRDTLEEAPRIPPMIRMRMIRR
jgi:ABC-2 type transport system ATP-binding protein